MSRRLLAILSAVWLLALSGCLGITYSSDEGSTNATPDVAPVGEAEPFVVKGRVTTTTGEPLSGAEVWADNTLAYNSNALATTNEQGEYRIELPRADVTTWRVGGQAKLQFHGHNYEVSLAGDQTVFGSAEGAVRDLTMVLNGKVPETNDQFYGVTVSIYTDYEDEGVEDTDNLEVTLVPDGPLIDGSQGQSITQRVSGWQVLDVPIGSYTMTAKYYRPDGTVVDLMVRVRNSQTEYAMSVTAVVPPEGELAFEIKTP